MRMFWYTYAMQLLQQKCLKHRQEMMSTSDSTQAQA